MNSHNGEYPPKILIGACKAIGLIVSKIAWRIRFSGIENIPAEDGNGLIIAANHQTYCDPVWLCLKVNRKFRFMAWDDVFNWFLVGRLIRYLGAFPVGLNRSGFVKATRKARQVLDEGATLIIFPEAEREFSDGKVMPFKIGSIRLAMDAGVPILPVTIRGGNKVWAQDHRFPRIGKVEIIYHPIFNVMKPTDIKDTHLLANKLNEQLTQVISKPLK